ncbi:hypothetical protein F3Y22_tig00110745pilonHSYRG00208 [Hibiscus syriacus]|uniref:Uncharacterized protein n=1 Tax=Hibiscus syriacus TaxID=106335 RepID=A0A6A2ZTG7_HIBSY|nr:hypothetical protein F3Y22_tig00110745pilonHSYRG00208 [Hibiscus syriacus]
MAGDFVAKAKIYAVPVGLFSLAMIYHLVLLPRTFPPSHYDGIPSVAAFPPGCKTSDCLIRFEGALSVDAVIDWFAMAILNSLRIFYYTKESLSALAKEGIEVQISSWGYIWKSCVILFKSDEEMKEAWMKRSELLCFWFDRLSPLLNEGGVPMAFCLVELYGVLLLCWQEAFLEKLAGRWGTVEAIQESTKNKEDLMTVKILVRMVSSFDVPFSLENYSDGRDTASEPSEMKAYNLKSNDKIGTARLVEDARKKVNTWMEQEVSFGFVEVGRGYQFLRRNRDGKCINEGMSDLHSFGIYNKGEFAGLGIRNLNNSNFSSQAQSVESSDPISPIKKIIPTGPAVQISRLGFPCHKQCMLSPSSSKEEALVTWEISKMLGISFKEGKKAFLDKIMNLEKVLSGSGGDNWGKKPFRLFNYLMNENEFDEQVVAAIKECKKVQRRAGILNIIRSSKSSIKNGLEGEMFPGAVIFSLEVKIHQLEKDLQTQQVVRGTDSVAELHSLRFEL